MARVTTRSKTSAAPAASRPARASKTATRESAQALDAHELKREKILNVAENLFFRHGFSGTTIDQIAEKLGVTKPFVYYYFQNKNDLYETLAWRSSNAVLTCLRFEPDDTRPAVVKLREGLRAFAASNLSYFKAGTFYYRERGPIRPLIIKKMDKLAREFLDELYKLLDEGRATGDLEFRSTKMTAVAVGSIIGFMHTWYRPNGKLGPAEMTEELTHIMLHLIGDKEYAKTGKTGADFIMPLPLTMLDDDDGPAPVVTPPASKTKRKRTQD